MASPRAATIWWSGSRLGWQRCRPRACSGWRRDGQALRGEDDAQDVARRLALALDESYLAIQGPPGSGKSTVGARMIVDLVAAGKRVGVTANSHKVIGELLEKTAGVAQERGVQVAIGQRPGRDGLTYAKAIHLRDNVAARDGLDDGTLNVVSGTAWLWARDDMVRSVDVLFIDEAGQMSLADAIAASSCATNLVLLGDPQQLDQPLQGTHPPGAERSALAHVLDGEQVMPDHLGVFSTAHGVCTRVSAPTERLGRCGSRTRSLGSWSAPPRRRARQSLPRPTAHHPKGGGCVSIAQRDRDRAGSYRSTAISLARARMREASCQACIRSSMSMLTSNAFSMRSAISGESEALPFSSAESVLLRTPRIATALVTLRPSSSMTSARMKSPG